MPTWSPEILSMHTKLRLCWIESRIFTLNSNLPRRPLPMKPRTHPDFMVTFPSGMMPVRKPGIWQWPTTAFLTASNRTHHWSLFWLKKLMNTKNRLQNRLSRTFNTILNNGCCWIRCKIFKKSPVISRRRRSRKP